MQNGVVDLVFGGKSYRLRFNVQSGLLFQSRVAEHKFKAGTMESNIALLNELFYCGLYGESLRSGTGVISYQESLDLFDEFGASPTFSEDCAKLWTSFSESVIGSAYVNEGKKKAEAESLQ